MSRSEAAETEKETQALLKQALIELRAMRKQVRAMKRAEREPIAVVGMACRFPGDSDTPEAYWDLLRNGRSGVCEVPRDRFDINAYYDPDPDAPGKIYTRHGGYLRSIDGFDARFFGISAREAAHMDPQQRLLMEVTWEALERANINPQGIYGSNTGVFLGIGNWEHAVIRFGMEAPDRIGPYTGTGSCACVASGRIAYTLGLTGPNFAVDTACSSSLLSAHLACDSLRRGDCDMALAGGTHLLLLPGLTVCFCRARMLAPDGRCKAFDAAADGYVRSEGCGMLVLKRLSDAEADGDRIYALIRGSATNQDGSSGGLTVPSGPAQEDVIRRALTAAGLEPDQVGYLEAHGTGTKLGDPVEMRALGNVFSRGARRRPLVVGSLKTNLGHLESSAGVAALIKTILVMQHKAIPPHLHLTKKNPLIEWERLQVEIPRELMDWETLDGESRIAGVSSFGFSGTNVHLIVEEYRREPPAESAERERSERATAQTCMLALSAKDPEALKQLAGRYAGFVKAHPGVILRDFCYTANTARAQLPYRLAILADSAEQMRERLERAAADAVSEGTLGSANLGDSMRAPPSPPTTERRAEDPWSQLAQAYAEGASAKPPAMDYGARPRKLVLPSYPFQHQRFPFQADAESAPGPRTQAPILHPLLGRRLDSAGNEILFEAMLGPDAPALLADHGVLGKTVLPGAAFVEMALKAGQIAIGEGASLARVSIREPMVLSGPHTAQTVLSPRAEGGFDFKIFGRAAGSKVAWQLHAAGTLAAAAPIARLEHPRPQTLLETFDRELPPLDWYEAFAARGLRYGPRFRVLERVWLPGDRAPDARQPALEALGLVRLGAGGADASQREAFCLNPALLDGCFQLVQVLAMQQAPERGYLPVSVERVVIHGLAPAAVWARARLTHVGDGHLKASVDLYDEEGRPVAELVDLVGMPIGADAFSAQGREDFDRFRYALSWEARTEPAAATEEVTGAWLVLAAEGDAVAADLADLLAAHGATPILASRSEAYREHSAARFSLPMTERAEVRRLLSRITAGAGPFRGVIHLLGATEEASEQAGTLALQSAVTLVQALLELPRDACPRLWLATRGVVHPVHTKGEREPTACAPFAAPLWGLGRALAVEQPRLKPVCIDLPPAGADGAASLFTELRRPEDEDQIVWRHGARYVPRLVRDGGPGRGGTARHADLPVRLTLTEYGSMDYLCLKPQEPMAPGAGEVIVEVRAAGLNFRDVLHALGMLKEHAEAIGIRSAAEMPFGFEGSGTVTAVGAGVSHVKPGDDVIAVLSSGTLASFTRVRAEFVVPKPPGISHVEAATLATAYLTAIYGLERLARIQPGDKVLIHAAASGVGLAAVHLVQALGGEVFATASPSKWSVLRAMGVRHIMHSRTLDFAAQVLEATDERGVDIVLNSLNGEFIPKNLSVLARGGRFIEIGKLGIWSAEQVAQVRPDVRYTSFDLSMIARERPALIAEMLAEVTAHVASGRVRPLPYRAFPLKDAANAFRTMAQGKHIGKVVITVHDAPGTSRDIRPDATYLITGGLGAIGLALARWLVARGARSLALLGRSEPTDAARATLAELADQGAEVRVMRADVTREAELRGAFAVIDAEMPPLTGVFHAAGALDDAPIGELSWPRFAGVLGAKVGGGWLLHELTRERALDHFVLFSSIAAVLGNPGQSSYAAANAFLDALAHYRHASDLPAVSINWGMWDVGGMAVSASRLASIGAAAMPPATCLAILETILREQPIQSCVVDLDFATYAARMGLPRGKGLLARLLPASAAPARGASAQPALCESLRAAVPSERLRILLQHVRQVTAKLLGFAADQVALDQPLTHQGVDSLMAVELRNKLDQDLGAELPVSLIYDYPTLSRMAAFLLDEVLDLKAATEVEEAKITPAESVSGEELLAEMEALLN